MASTNLNTNREKAYLKTKELFSIVGGEKYGVDNPAKLKKKYIKKEKKIKTPKPIQKDENKVTLREIILPNDFIKTLIGQTGYLNIQQDKEKDLYILEDINLAIDYSILSEGNELSTPPKLRQYHNNKRVLCEKKSIRLITIFEDEWIHREKQVLNFLKSVIGYYEKKVYARKTTFKEITKEESRKFLEENHIQSFAKLSRYYFGLYNNDELISVMTFGKHHRQGQDDTVLDRFAVKEGYSIPGGASKLFKNACMLLPKGKIISWSDNRWSQGNVYEKLGFNLEEGLPPDYSYVPKSNPNMIRISKQSQQKKKTNCPPDLTEREWCLKRDLYRIWDCGKKRWVINNEVGFDKEVDAYGWLT